MGPIHFKQLPYNEALLKQSCELHPFLRRVLSADGIESCDEIEYDLKRLLLPAELTNLEQGAALLAEHVQSDSSILIFGNYNADGATSTALFRHSCWHLSVKGVELLEVDERNAAPYLEGRPV